MQVFLSHNSDNKADARLLATSLVERGASVWLDEWNIRPGESIAAGIEAGLAASSVLCLIWSEAAARSQWVGAELRAYLHQRMANEDLRIVPVMLDATPLPLLVADYRGFVIGKVEDYGAIADELSGSKEGVELASLLQQRLWELAKGKIPEGSPHKYVVCPSCGSENLKHMKFFDHYSEKMLYSVMCMERDCKFMQAEKQAE